MPRQRNLFEAMKKPKFFSNSPYPNLRVCASSKDEYCLTPEEFQLIQNPSYGKDLPSFLKPFSEKQMPPNETMIYYTAVKKDGSPRVDSAKQVLRFYGVYGGRPFTHRDLKEKKFRKAIAIHDAPHSVALFLKEHAKEPGQRFALHSTTPFQFPWVAEYVKYFTQTPFKGKGVNSPGNFPLVITTRVVPPEKDLKVQGVPKRGDMFGRWCTKKYKLRPARSLYQQFNQCGITQLLGETKHQSSRRAKKNPAKVEAGSFSTKTCRIFNELPIFDMEDATQIELMEKAGIKKNPWVQEVGQHGCMYCPQRGPEFYKWLKEENPEMYEACDLFRKAGSSRPTKGPRDPRFEEYYWFLEPMQKREFDPETREWKWVFEEKVKIIEDPETGKKTRKKVKIPKMIGGLTAKQLEEDPSLKRIM